MQNARAAAAARNLADVAGLVEEVRRGAEPVARGGGEARANARGAEVARYDLAAEVGDVGARGVEVAVRGEVLVVGEGVRLGDDDVSAQAEAVGVVGVPKVAYEGHIGGVGVEEVHVVHSFLVTEDTIIHGVDKQVVGAAVLLPCGLCANMPQQRKHILIKDVCTLIVPTS